MKNCENFCHYVPFLPNEGLQNLHSYYSLDVLIKMLANNLAVLNQQTLERTNQCSLLSNTVDGELSTCLILGRHEPVIKPVWICRLGPGLMVSGIDLAFTFCSKKLTFAEGAQQGTH